MSAGYDLVLLKQIACNAIGINAAAGGAATFQNTASYMQCAQTIACNLRNANIALGNPATGGGGFDTLPNLFAYIACQAQAMSGVAVPFDPYSSLSVWNAIDCALGVVAINTGQGFSGWANNSVQNLMYGAVCLTGQIVTNGFGPPPVAATFHYAADGLSAGALSTWPNLVAGGFNLSGQATVVAAGQNGLNIVRLASASNQTMSTAFTIPSPVQRTIIVALRSTDKSNTNVCTNIGAGTAASRTSILRIGTGDWAFGANGTGGNVKYPGLTNMDTPPVLAFTSDSPGNAVKLYTNGALAASTSHNGGDTGGANSFRICSTTGIAGFKNVDFFEIYGFNQIISDAQIASISAALQSKWNLPPFNVVTNTGQQVVTAPGGANVITSPP